MKNNSVIAPPSQKLGPNYNPEAFESELYRFWEESGCFDAADENAEGQDSFCIVIPPPNVTGVLHMGHALTNAIQDILIRWRRMCGDNALWLPGTDHAGIATQAQVEKHIAKEKGPDGKPLSRHDLGRDAFLERTWKWKEEHGNKITNQQKRLGNSLDWKRERFTMDEGFSSAVREVFVRLYEEGLIYRGERVINWCTRCQTALSDLEVIPNERKSNLWEIRYPVFEDEEGTIPVKNGDGSPASVVISTTRPETLLGDTAIAVHPEDERYQHLHGKRAKLPLIGRMLPVIADGYVDREFGTGALKITPAHDFNDYEIGLRHSLPAISAMGKDGKITSEGGAYAGLTFKEAREKIVEDLKSANQLVNVEDYVHKVGLCQRCDSVAEPVISKQWFVKIQPLAKPAIEAVETGQIQFSPKSWEKTYFEWMYNIRDWCISRQLWWGHQIPAWYCQKCEGVTVARSNPEACSSCGGSADQLKRDEDVLDTWFSSGLWPFGTLGWPNQTTSLKTFYPTAILETGFDIIFFWVARMIMMGIHFMGEVPFHRVYLHAMVRDEKGEKMSKSKGNVIDPLVLIDEFGADSLRFTLAIMAGQGRDVKLSVDRVKGYRTFCNKLWNATKFILIQWEEAEKSGKLEEPSEGAEAWLESNRKQLAPQNQWILSRLQDTAEKMNGGLDRFELNVASQAVYGFVWHEFCDWFIELSKLPLREKQDHYLESLITLHYVLESSLRLTHPFMPFVTEQLWQALPWKRASNTLGRKKEGMPDVMTLMFQSFPQGNESFVDSAAEKLMTQLKSIVDLIRNFRGENQIPPKKRFEVRYRAQSDEVNSFLGSFRSEVESLAGISKLVEDPSEKSGASDAILPLSSPLVELRISLEGLVDFEEESKRVNKEIEKLRGDIQHVARKLSNPSFVKKAPTQLVEKEKLKEQNLRQKLEELEAALKRMEH